MAASPDSSIAAQLSRIPGFDISKRVVMLGILVMIMMIPLTMIGDLINERSYRRYDVENEIAGQWGGFQIVGGPVLMVPYVTRSTFTRNDGSTGVTVTERTAFFLPQALAIEASLNSELRRLNAAKIGSFAAESAPELLWRGEVFHPFTNNAVESAFADRRTYYYQGREVDRQVHLGFDLASYAQTPIVAANRGRVVFADELGIYGNAVIIDHGLGLQSLYAHLSTIDVAPGAMVEKDQPIGRSGMTGLAGGDHLHFTMLVHGRAVNPVEWWDPHWITDRVDRKLREAGR